MGERHKRDPRRVLRIGKRMAIHVKLLKFCQSVWVVERFSDRLNRLASAATRGLALRPWPMMLMRIVQTTVIDRVVPPGRCALITITANTMLASPRGPNQPMKRFWSVRSCRPPSTMKTGSILTTGRLKKRRSNPNYGNVQNQSRKQKGIPKFKPSTIFTICELYSQIVNLDSEPL